MNEDTGAVVPTNTTTGIPQVPTINKPESRADKVRRIIRRRREKSVSLNNSIS